MAVWEKYLIDNAFSNSTMKYSPRNISSVNLLIKRRYSMFVMGLNRKTDTPHRDKRYPIVCVCTFKFIAS